MYAILLLLSAFAASPVHAQASAPPASELARWERRHGDDGAAALAASA